MVLSDIEAADAGDTFIFDTKTGSLVASVSMHSESYVKRSDGRLAPSGSCGGPSSLRVGPILSAQCKRAGERTEERVEQDAGGLR